MRRTWRSRAWLAVGAATATVVGMSVVVPASPATSAPPVTVSLLFTDGLATQYTYGGPVLKSHGVNGTFYAASNWALTNDAKYMRTYQLDSLYRDGNEIGGMGRDHKDLTATYSSDPAADLAYKQDQVCGDRQVWSNLGYDPQNFTYPASAANTAAESVVSGCGYRSGRLVGGLNATGPTYAETIPPANAFRLRTANVPTGPITLQSLQTAVTAASGHGGGWLPISFNDVCSSSDPAFSACMGRPKPIQDTVLSSFLDWVATGAPAGTTVRTVRDVVGAPTPPPLPPRPTAVSLTFDDGLASQYGMRSALAAHNDKATFYIPSADIDAGAPGNMSWDQIQTLAADGHDIGGHTLHHVNLTATDTSFDSKWHEACDDRARLVAKGFNPVSFAYPFAAFNAAAEGIVKGCGYQSARTGGALNVPPSPYAERIPPKDAYAVQALGGTYNGPITLAVLQDATNNVIEHGGGWLPMIFHEVCYPNAASYQACMNGYRPVDATTLEGFMTWLDDNAGRGVSVKSMTDVMGGGRPSPQVVVNAPASGSSVRTTRPLVSGSADSAGGDVAVDLFQGAYSTGTPMATMTATNAGGTWSVQPGTALADGRYTVQARQTRNGVVGLSPPVTFTVASDGTAPNVNLTSPQHGSTVAASATIVSSASPAALPRDSTGVTLTVNGIGFVDGARASISGSGVRVTSIAVMSPTSLAVTVNVSDSARTGARDIIVTAPNSAGGGCTGCLRVNAAPRPTRSSPSSLGQGGTKQTVRLAGTGFQAGTSVQVSGSGVTATVTKMTATSLSLSVSVDVGARPGARDLTVVNPDGGSGTCSGCFTWSPVRGPRR